MQITLKTRVDLYVGKVIESPDPNGIKVLCVVTAIDKVHVQGGKMTLDCKVQPLHLLNG